MADIERTEHAGVSRRTVTKAMAWAVPAVAVATTAPLAAASCIPELTMSDRSCKCPGQSTGDPFTFNIELCAGGISCPDSSLSINVTKIVKRNSGDILWQGSQDIATGDCAVFTGASTDSGTWIDVTYSIGDVAQPLLGLQSPPDCDKVEDPIQVCAD
ncbi:hypothetical protein [Agromyces sp. H66]|uniref:hypothetical protein n=1 Tax=Agromyces sp. H66 TaxID=2529859 RepID=UPI0010AAA8EC|nr:hypothetical protein [Agromyces sp. H66]